MSDEEMAKEPSLNRLRKVGSGEQPAVIEVVSAVAYQHGAQLANHTDVAKSLFTFSVAIGNACTFTIGKKTTNPHKFERSGSKVTVQM